MVRGSNIFLAFHGSKKSCVHSHQGIRRQHAIYFNISRDVLLLECPDSFSLTDLTLNMRQESPDILHKTFYVFTLKQNVLRCIPAESQLVRHSARDPVIM